MLLSQSLQATTDTAELHDILIGMAAATKGLLSSPALPNWERLSQDVLARKDAIITERTRDWPPCSVMAERWKNCGRSRSMLKRHRLIA